MMFPHLIAGPIVRYTDIDYELYKRSINIDKIGLGIQYLIVGLSQKVIIANTVSGAADHVFSLPNSDITTGAAWIGVFAYTIQIYFDFCGYSNMAIGLAFMLGFRFPINFNYPYSSSSISEFWRRWHISLSFWFRDYVYIPLGGNRRGPVRTARNLLAVFFLAGLWHGPSWTFVFWGLFHGTFLFAERVGLRNRLDRAPIVVGWLYTIVVVMIGWVLFRASDLPGAQAILSAMAGFGTSNKSEPMQLWLNPEVLTAMLVGAVLSFPTLPRVLAALRMPELLGPVIPGTAHTEVTLVHLIPVPVLILGLCLSCLLLISSGLNPFLYFRF